jgi:hypothetical protein
LLFGMLLCLPALRALFRIILSVHRKHSPAAAQRRAFIFQGRNPIKRFAIYARLLRPHVLPLATPKICGALQSHFWCAAQFSTRMHCRSAHPGYARHAFGSVDRKRRRLREPYRAYQIEFWHHSVGCTTSAQCCGCGC